VRLESCLVSIGDRRFGLHTTQLLMHHHHYQESFHSSSTDTRRGRQEVRRVHWDFRTRRRHSMRLNSSRSSVGFTEQSMFCCCNKKINNSAVQSALHTRATSGAASSCPARAAYGVLHGFSTRFFYQCFVSAFSLYVCVCVATVIFVEGFSRFFHFFLQFFSSS